MSAKSTKKPVCFVISPIGEKGSDVRKHVDMVLGSIIRPALEENFEVKRSDEFGKPEMITHQIVQAIETSELAVALLTFLNPNVFYELGLRHLAKLPAIHLAQDGLSLPFDTAGMATIFYDVSDHHSHVGARKELSLHATEVTSKGYVVNNPVTVSKAFTAAIESGDKEQVHLATLLQEVSDLRLEVHSLRLQQNADRRHPVRNAMNNAMVQHAIDEARSAVANPSNTQMDKALKLFMTYLDDREKERNKDTKD